MNRTIIAWNRFGLGPRFGDKAPADPKEWLLRQIATYDPRPDAIAARPRSEESAAQLAAFLTNRRRARQMRAADPAYRPDQSGREAIRAKLVADVGARMRTAIVTDAPFAERLVHFWSNHFTVSMEKRQITALVGPHEFDAIRPNIMGNFRDLLRAAVLHPAMFGYLDQSQSTGPGSMLARRAARRGTREAGLNENLAREVLDLHTLGVDGGYSQEDVTEFARALTGWTMMGLARAHGAQDMGGGTGWAEYQHEPGTRTILGLRFADDGPQQSIAILDHLAGHPATARHVATKLARHFSADEPTEPLVDRLAETFRRTSGDLPSLYRTLVTSPEPWAAKQEMAKFRTPWDWSVASLRALALDEFQPRLATRLLRELGQPCWSAKSPKGYDDIAASWAAPDALTRRVDAANQLSALARVGDPSELARQMFPDGLNDTTVTSIRRAESGRQGLALLLASPEMMWR